MGRYGNETSGPGTSLDYCLACPRGKYGPNKGVEGALSCFDCPSGKRGVLEGQSSMEAACRACPTGRYQDLPGMTKCKLCAMGKEAAQAEEGSSYCIACAAGKTSTAHRRQLYHDAECKDKVEEWQDSAGDTCDGYGANHWCEQYGDHYRGAGNFTANEACCACGGGDRGSTKRPTTFSPTKFPTGNPPTKVPTAFTTYMPTSRRPTRLPTESPTYFVLESTPRCKSCDPGFYSDSGASSCFECPAGKVSGSSGSASCHACPSALYLEPNRNRTKCMCVKIHLYWMNLLKVLKRGSTYHALAVKTRRTMIYRESVRYAPKGTLKKRWGLSTKLCVAKDNTTMNILIFSLFCFHCS